MNTVVNHAGKLPTNHHRHSRNVSSKESLEALIGTIRAVPYQQFGCNKVVLRAQFQLRLATLLPVNTRVALATRYNRPIEELFETIPMQVDLFPPSTGPQHGLKAFKLSAEGGLGPTAIGKALGITKRQAAIAVEFGEKLRAAGLNDAYIELQKPPEAASRWRTHLRHQSVTDKSAD